MFSYINQIHNLISVSPTYYNSFNSLQCTVFRRTTIVVIETNHRTITFIPFNWYTNVVSNTPTENGTINLTDYRITPHPNEFLSV